MAELTVVSYRPDPSEFAWTFGGVPPVRSVAAGSVLELWTEDAFAGKIHTVDDLVSNVIQFPFVNPQTGPFFVEGAEPGDTLALHFVSLTPARDHAASTTIPLFGSLTSTHVTATLQPPLEEIVWIYEVDRERGTVGFQSRRGDFTIDLPIEAMHGTVGVAPAAFEARSSLVPDAHGGNMDTPEMRAGATCYLGVNVPGALFSIGDGHYRQGEGESCGVAVEGAMDTVLIVDVIKGMTTPWPRLENDEYVMSVGSARPLEDAFRIAHTDMVTWLSSAFGLDPLDAYQLVTQGAQTPVANVVDPNYSIVCKMRKRWLPSASVYAGAHGRLKEMAEAYRSDR
jgi:acetamidase/formamidase